MFQDTTQAGTQGLQEYHSQYQCGYGSVCILRCLCNKIKLVLTISYTQSISMQIRHCCIPHVSVLQDTIPNLYLSFKKVIQDASCLLTKKNYSHTVIKAEYFRTNVYLDIYVTG